MKRVLVLGVVAALSLQAHHGFGFMEEGFNGEPIVRNGFTRCRTVGGLLEAEYYGCNPWPDHDANYSFREREDQEKSSVHYNATAALAVAAGFSPCAAYVLALFDQATDVATESDALFWAPFLPGVDMESCEALFEEEGVTPAMGLARMGAYIAFDFTFRGASKDTNEIARESMTFHFNPGLDDFLTERTYVSCDPDDDRDPLPYPDHDVVPLSDLYAWASSDVNPLNACPYGGPIANYDPEEDVGPGTLGSFGVFLHAYQDAFSHRDMIDRGVHVHVKGNLNTHSIQGFVTGHFAGEFGVDEMGRLGNGRDGNLVKVTTPAGEYLVWLHSEDTYDALVSSYQRMVEWLYDPDAPDRVARYGRPGATICSLDDVELFAYEFASIANYVPDEGEPSGARRRSEMADSLFSSRDCSWEVAW